jgi:hypothetical protein
VISLIYFLIASCFLIGCFANFAGNTYGSSMALSATAAFTLFLFISGLNNARKLWSRSIAGAMLVMAECWLVAIGLCGILMKFSHKLGAAITIIFGFGFASLFFLFKSLGNLYGMRKKENRLACFEAFLLQLFCSVSLSTTMAKFMHWPAAPGLFAALLLIGIILIFSITKQLMKSIRINRSSNATHFSPTRAYFIILLVGMLHNAGSRAGWVPKFQFLDKPQTMIKLEQQAESEVQQIRLQNYHSNLACFFGKYGQDGQKNTNVEEGNFYVGE